ncbi:hypothetical protein A4A71_01785 [Nicoletella semolina]|nr:hypothetical protein [Nicoletella semolina]
MCVICLSICLAACSTLFEPEQAQIYDIKAQKYISVESLVKQLEKSPLILVGERHDVKLHHDIQRWLIAQLHSPRSVVLEMLPSTQQKTLDQELSAIRKNMINNDRLYILPKHINWQAAWDWRQYGELVNTIVNSQHRLMGGNLDKEEIRTIMQGAYPLIGKKSTALSVQQQLEALITQAHHGVEIQDKQLKKFVQTQQFKDRRMAEILVKNKPSILIAGNVHTSKSVGVPLHLDDYEQSDYVVLKLGSKQDIEQKQADFIWITDK